MISPRFIRFLLAGGLAALANFGSRILLSTVFPYVVAIILAYGIGMVTAFILVRLFVFERSDNPLHQQAFWFTLVNFAAVLQTIAISLFFARLIFPGLGFKWHVETVAHGIGVIFPVFTSYLGHKHLSFRRVESKT